MITFTRRDTYYVQVNVHQKKYIFTFSEIKWTVIEKAYITERYDTFDKSFFLVAT
jgi:hypothetical protein